MTLLLLIVPLRHVILNTDGLTTGLVLLGVGAASIAIGLNVEWKSGWCSGLCPVHPVEKLYGIRPMISVRNAHCTECFRCTDVCPDSTPGMHPLVTPRTAPHAIAGSLLVGGFPGYIWGWFQVPDTVGATSRGIVEAYTYPFVGLMLTLGLYLAVRRAIPGRHRELLVSAFAAAAVSCYYFFRLPMLVGFGAHPGEGTLIDLRSALPAWTPIVLQVVPALFFVWHFLIRTRPRRPWAVRPAYAPAFAPAAVRTQAR